MFDALTRLDSGTWVLVALAAIVIVPLLYGFVQGLRGKEPKRDSVGKAIASAFEPGGFLYERNQAVRPIMERRGLAFEYWVYRPPDGSAVAFTWRQLTELGGPFRLFVTPLQEVYGGTLGDTRVTIGHVYTGDVGDREERMAAVFALRGRTLPAFVAAPRRFARGATGETLRFPSHPQLDETHGIRGDEAARPLLSGPVLDALVRDDGWAFESKGATLVIYRTALQRDTGGFLEVSEIAAFVDEAFRLAGLFGATVSADRAVPRLRH